AWYDAATGGNLLGVGTPLTRQFGVLSRTIYVEGVNLLTAMPQGSHPLNDNNGGDLLRSNPSFNALEAFTLVSVDVAPSAFCGTPGTIRLQQNGVDVPGTTIALPACNTTSYQTVVLNYNIPAGNNYSLVYSGGTARYQFRNSFTPTTFGDVVRVNGNVFGTGSFFNWQIRSGSPCIRTPLDLNCVLPVRFHSEKIKLNDNQNVLSFEISEASGFKTFIIEASKDGINFETIGTLKYHIHQNTYSFSFSRTINMSYFRVRTEEENPSFSRLMFWGSENELAFTASPNPFQESFMIGSKNSENEQVVIDVFNLSGQMVEKNRLVEPYQPIGEDWQQGVYVLHIKTESTYKLMKVVKK
ncbi:MAG: T9SS type A sorting domain-containing protein, partial [Cytophagales bacterium]